MSTGKVGNGLIGLSQGGGMSDYEDATAQKLKEAGFKWFRMDNVFTGVLKKSKDGQFTNDWRDFDKRVDFINRMGADPIIAVSYMPQVLDAVANNDRQSAPRDYGAWEELCFEAAKHSLQRGRRVPFSEVWNEVNSRLAQTRTRGHRQRTFSEPVHTGPGEGSNQPGDHPALRSLL